MESWSQWKFMAFRCAAKRRLSVGQLWLLVRRLWLATYFAPTVAWISSLTSPVLTPTHVRKLFRGLSWRKTAEGKIRYEKRNFKPSIFTLHDYPQKVQEVNWKWTVNSRIDFSRQLSSIKCSPRKFCLRARNKIESISIERRGPGDRRMEAEEHHLVLSSFLYQNFSFHNLFNHDPRRWRMAPSIVRKAQRQGRGWLFAKF